MKKIIGIAVRTINKNGQAQKEIGVLWNRWFTEDIASKIENKVSADIYNIYTEYESDFTGYYTAILGVEVSSFDIVPEGLVTIEIPDLAFKQYVSEGKLPDCVANTWQEIWKSNIDRAYKLDFDRYDATTVGTGKAKVVTYISVK